MGRKPGKVSSEEQLEVAKEGIRCRSTAEGAVWGLTYVKTRQVAIIGGDGSNPIRPPTDTLQIH